MLAWALSGWIVGGVAAQAQAAPPPATLSRAVAEAVRESDSQSAPPYRFALTDLDGDGRDDAIVLLDSAEWCGSGGCTMLLLRGTADGFRLVSRATVTRPPVRVLDERRHGWRTLVVHSGREERRLRFDGRHYPGNPSVEPVATAAEVAAGRVVIADAPPPG